MPRLLVVDDEAGIRDVLTRFLTQRGYEVDDASNGEEALQRLREGGVDGTVLDLLLPGLSGLGVLRRIQEQQLDAGYVIAISGQTHAASLGLDAMELSAHHFLPKPFDLNILETIMSGGIAVAAPAVEPGPGENLRAHPRIQVSLPIQVDLGTYGRTLVGETVNLSKGGVQVVVADEVSLGAGCTVRIPQASRTQVKEGTVIRSEPDVDGFRIAIKFTPDRAPQTSHKLI